MLEFSCNRRARLGIEDSSPPLIDTAMEKEDQQSSQGNNQEDNTMDEHSKVSILDTPSMNIRDSQSIAKILEITLESCSKDSEKIVILNENVLQGVVGEQVPRLSEEIGKENKDKSLPDETVAGESAEEIGDPVDWEY